MLLFIFVAILVAGIAFMVHDNRINNYTRKVIELPGFHVTVKDSSGWGYIGGTCLAIGIITVAISIVIMMVNYIPAEGEREMLEVRRESLVFQYDHDMYDNDNDIGKKELMDDIQEFNMVINFGKRMQRDFWIGIYIPNIYDNLKLIDISAKER